MGLEEIRGGIKSGEAAPRFGEGGDSGAGGVGSQRGRRPGVESAWKLKVGVTRGFARRCPRRTPRCSQGRGHGDPGMSLLLGRGLGQPGPAASPAGGSPEI